jgi:4-hydroxybutyrate CoA-transferase
MKAPNSKIDPIAAFLERNLGSGQRVVLGHAAAEPTALVSRLLARAPQVQGVEVLHMVPMGSCDYCSPEYSRSFRHNAVFVGGPSRGAVSEGRADFTPVFFSELPALFRKGLLPVDLAMICVSPPDSEGFVSLGVSSDYTLQAAKSARFVVAEVNHCMPRTFGSKLHVSELHAVIETERPLPELKARPPSEVERKIGQHIEGLIQDGDCLQLGIGTIPDAVLECLRDKSDLGIHTEMFSDGVVRLLKAGNITNSRKDLHKGITVATFLMGTQELYHHVHENPHILMKPVDYTNDVCIGGQIANLKSINSAIEVDLYGQVCADMIGSTQFSSVG